MADAYPRRGEAVGRATGKMADAYPRRGAAVGRARIFKGGIVMAFTLSGFIKRGLIAAVGRMADYQIILNAVGWLEKGVLTEADLAEIQAAIDAQYIVPEEPVIEDEGGEMVDVLTDDSAEAVAQ